MRLLAPRPAAPVLAASLLGVMLVAHPVAAAGGDVDPTFSGDGRVVSDFGYDDRADGVAVQPNGAIVVAGTSCGGDFLVARYNPDGTPDATFDGDGATCIDIGGGSADRGEEVVVLPDGRLLVGGTSAGNFALVRLAADGRLDTTFGADGKAVFDLGGTEELHDLAVAPDGRMVMAGETTAAGCPLAPVTPGQTAAVAVARALPDGSLDATFGGGGGKVVLADPGRVQRGFGVAVQSDGAVIVAGRSSSCTRVAIGVLLVRLTPAGAVDPGFTPVNPVGGTGPSSAADVAVQPDGRIVVAVDTFVGPATSPEHDDAFTVLRFNPDGSADTTFGGDGAAMALFGAGRNATPAAVALQGGKIVVGGSVDGDFALARFDADGTLDSTFGGDGMVETDFGGIDAIAALAVQPDGKLVAAGRTGSDVALARYGTGGTTTPPVTTPSPFAQVCTVLQQLAARFAADPVLRSFAPVIQNVGTGFGCPLG